MKIESLVIVHPEYGLWRFENAADGTRIGGKPFPSEAEAHVFQTQFIPELEKAMREVYNRVFHLE